MARLRDLCFDLPPSLEDVTEYFFSSTAGPILDLPLRHLALASTQLDAWLLAARERVRTVPNAKLSALRTYENPSYLLRGFEADCGGRALVTVLVALEQGALLLQPKCAGGYDAALRQILRTLQRVNEAPLPPEPGALSYSAAGFRFQCAQALEEPAFLSLRSQDGAMRVLGQASPKRLKMTEPVWAASFGLGPASVTTELLQGRHVIGGFHSQLWLAASRDEDEQQELCWGQAVARTERHYFRFELKGSGPACLEQWDVWAALLASARRG